MLSKIWHQQREYNKKIFALEGGDEPNYWSRQYLLGISSQIAEVLREIKWKRHRQENGKRIVPQNVLEEIADIMKYSISLAQVWGFTEDDLLSAMHEKGEILDFRLRMEFKEPLKGRKILITDVDGTLADYATAFSNLLRDEDAAKLKEITSILLDDSLEMTYPEYYAIKEKFEEEGGYRNMLPYDDTEFVMKCMGKNGYHIIAVTSRPAHVYKRIFKDTLYWFNSYKLPIDELYMTGSGRVLMACELAKDNEVVLWDDDPEILRRASNSGVETYARRHPYNTHMRIPNVTIVDSYIKYLTDKELK